MSLVDQCTRGYESSAFCSLIENEKLTYLPASDSDDGDDRIISQSIENFYRELGITLKGTCNIPKTMMMNDQPGPLFFIVECPDYITITQTSSMSSILLNKNRVIAEIFFKKSMYDSRAYINKIDEE